MRHCEQATEQSRQRVIADAVRAYCEKFVAGWLRLQMVQVMCFDLAHVLQSVLSCPGHLVARTTVLHCVHRNSVSSANSAFKEQTKHSVFDPSKKLLVRLTPHVLHVRVIELWFACPRDIAAVHATQDLQWPGRIHHSIISSRLLLAALKPSAGYAFSQEKHCQRFAACFLRFLWLSHFLANSWYSAIACADVYGSSPGVGEKRDSRSLSKQKGPGGQPC